MSAALASAIRRLLSARRVFAQPCAATRGTASVRLAVAWVMGCTMVKGPPGGPERRSESSRVMAPLAVNVGQ